MNIAFITGEPTNWNGNSLESGLGGSESMVLFYAEELAKTNDVWVLTQGQYAPVEINGVLWIGVNIPEIDTWPDMDSREVVISLRSPLHLEFLKKARVRALLANDQRCPSLPLAVDSGWCNLVICISYHQAQNYKQMYGLTDDIVLASCAGVRTKDFGNQRHDWDHCIYGSTPERGLGHFANLWPRILRERKSAHLTVTSGFQLYGWDDDKANRFGKGYYDSVRNLFHVHCLGRPYTRTEYVGTMNHAGLLLYPSTYDEQCCITALEAAAAGLPIITTDRAALSERVINGVTGYLIPGEPGTKEYDEQFVNRTLELLFDVRTAQMMGEVGRSFARDYDYSVLAKDWLRRFAE